METPQHLALFPDELKRSPRWCLWKYVTRGDKTTKLPFQPSGKPAESNNPATWGSFADALAALTDQYSGFGCFISDPYVAVDFDHVRDKETGEIEPWALAAIKELNSYTEISPSGEGLHVWCYGKVPAGRKRGHVEIYAEKRYFTVSALHLDGTPLTVNELPKDFHAKLEALDPQQKKPPTSEKRATLNTKQKFYYLERGDWKAAGYPSQSEADCAYCKHLLDVHNGDTQKVDADFRKSPLMRPKWDVVHDGASGTYGQMTISLALTSFKEKPVGAGNWRMLDQIEIEIIQWLWPNRIALGKLNLFTGKPDMAKSMITVDIASRLTTAKEWPNAVANELPASGTIFLCAEDDIADTVAPRFKAAGGDPKKVHILPSMVETHKDTQIERSFALDRDIETLRKRLTEFPDIRLIVIDPISAYFSSEKSINSEQDVREVLEPLRLLCAEFNVAAICLAHFNKTLNLDAIQKTLGSTALTAIMRMGWAFTDSDSEEDVRLMLCFKGNLTRNKKKLGLKYTTEGVDLEIKDRSTNVGRVKWLGESDADINEQLNIPPEEKTKLRAAEDWLREELKDGEWKNANQLIGKGAHDGDCSKRTLQDAARRLKIEKRGPKGNKMEWRLPSQQATLIESEGEI